MIFFVIIYRRTLKNFRPQIECNFLVCIKLKRFDLIEKRDDWILPSKIQKDTDLGALEHFMFQSIAFAR